MGNSANGNFMPDSMLKRKEKSTRERKSIERQNLANIFEKTKTTFCPKILYDTANCFEITGNQKQLVDQFLDSMRPTLTALKPKYT